MQQKSIVAVKNHCFIFSSEDEKQVTINDVRRGGSLQFLISARSIHTLVYES